MRRARQVHDEPAGSDASVSPFCVAGGCSMPGALSDNTKGGGPWFCRYHFGAEPRHWPAITEEVREARREGFREPNPTPSVLEMRAKLLPRGGIDAR